MPLFPKRPGALAVQVLVEAGFEQAGNSDEKLTLEG
jgi:hypothetical protein